MNDEEETVQTKVLEGRKVEYSIGEEKVSIGGYLLDDGGVHWEFCRGGRTYPLRISKIGMDAMIAVWHELMWVKSPSVKDKVQL